MTVNPLTSLIVGFSDCAPETIRQLKRDARKNSSSIIFFDPSIIRTEDIFDPMVSSLGVNQSNKSSSCVEFECSKVLNTDLKQQLASALIQENERFGESRQLLFHDILHANHMIWNLIQQYLLERDIDAIVFLHKPNSLIEAILYQVARALDKKVLLLTGENLKEIFFSFNSLRECGEYDQECRNSIDLNYDLSKSLSLSGDQQGKITCEGITILNIVKVMAFLIRVRPFLLCNLAYVLRRAKHLHDAPLSTKDWRDPFAKFFSCSRTAYFDFITNCQNVKSVLNNRFVYFPIQSLGTLTSEILFNKYSDQLLAIEQLARIIPKDCSIVINHCSEGAPDYLTPMFFHRIYRIPNVVRVHSCVDSEQLIDKCEIMATVSSPQGLRALFKGKKVIVFGRPWYCKVPGTYPYNDELTYEHILSSTYERERFDQEVSKLLVKSHVGSLNSKALSLSSNLSPEENARLVSKTIFDLLFGHIQTTFSVSSTQ